jgi:hypothetical protein
MPASGRTYRYYFRLYALDTTLTLPQASKRKAVDSAIKGHTIAEATLMGRYERKAASVERKPELRFHDNNHREFGKISCPCRLVERALFDVAFFCA